MTIPEKWCCMPFWCVFAIAAVLQVVEVIFAATSYQTNWFPIIMHLVVGVMYGLLFFLKDQYCYTLSVFIVTIVMLAIAFFGLFWNLFVYVIGDAGVLICGLGGLQASLEDAAQQMAATVQAASDGASLEEMEQQAE